MNFPQNLLYTSLKRAIKIQIFPAIFMTDWADIWHINCYGGKFWWKNPPKPLKSGFSGSAIFRIFFLSPKLLIKKYPLEKEIICLQGLDCEIRISGFPDPDFFEIFLDQSYFFLTNSMLAKFQLNRSCHFGAVKNESEYP